MILSIHNIGFFLYHLSIAKTTWWCRPRCSQEAPSVCNWLHDLLATAARQLWPSQKVAVVVPLPAARRRLSWPWISGNTTRASSEIMFNCAISSSSDCVVDIFRMKIENRNSRFSFIYLFYFFPRSLDSEPRFIPVTRRLKGYTSCVRKYETGIRKRFRPYEVFIFLVRNTSRLDLAMSACPFETEISETIIPREFAWFLRFWDSASLFQQSATHTVYLSCHIYLYCHKSTLGSEVWNIGTVAACISSFPSHSP